MSRPYPQWTIARVNQIMYQGKMTKKVQPMLTACPLLAANWQQTLSRQAKKSHSSDSVSRIWGEN